MSSELLTRGVRTPSDLRADGIDIYWNEGRADDGGRQVLVRHRPGSPPEDVVGAPYSVRTRVHEYGGAPYAVDSGEVWFSDFGSSRLHHRDAGGTIRALTPESDLRYADLEVDRARQRVLCVLEDHTTGAHEAVNTIAAVPMSGGAPTSLVVGHDFVAAPRLSPDGRFLAWISWEHPDMPWDATCLWVAELDGDGRPGDARLLGGGPEESAIEPSWSPDGALWFSTDRSGWWNLRRWDGSGAPLAVAPMEAETAGPPWVFGRGHHAHLGEGSLAVVATAAGRDRLLVIAGDGASRELHTDLTWFSSDLARRRGGGIATIAGSPDIEAGVVEIDLTTGAVTTLQRSLSVDVDPTYISRAEHITFPSAGGRVAHAELYRPHHPEVSIPAGELPPLRVIVHGGPTSATSAVLRWGVQYWTTRGFAVLDVDYGGSTGYGTAYRRLLDGAWGIVDLEDCEAGVRHLVAEGIVDPRRVCIMGGSAGGYTTLRALTASDVFAAGCSLFGVGDVGALARDTHKFESRYMDRMVGPYPEAEAVYAERSPLVHVDRLRVPIILFQGEDDRVVPPAQSRLFFAAARRVGVPCAYVEYPGEGHGFRVAANVRRTLDAELHFYGQAFDFEPADPLEPPLVVENAPDHPRG